MPSQETTIRSWVRKPGAITNSSSRASCCSRRRRLAWGRASEQSEGKRSSRVHYAGRSQENQRNGEERHERKLIRWSSQRRTAEAAASARRDAGRVTGHEWRCKAHPELIGGKPSCIACCPINNLPKA